MQNDLEMLAFAMNYIFEEMNTSLLFESKDNMQLCLLNYSKEESNWILNNWASCPFSYQFFNIKQPTTICR